MSKKEKEKQKTKTTFDNLKFLNFEYSNKLNCQNAFLRERVGHK